jgi:hypothetical protein
MIYPLRNGRCKLAGNDAFHGGNPAETHDYSLYLWLVLGGDQPILVETGPKDPEAFSKSTARYIPGGVRQLPGERTVEALKRHGIDPARAQSGRVCLPRGDGENPCPGGHRGACA